MSSAKRRAEGTKNHRGKGTKTHRLKGTKAAVQQDTALQASPSLTPPKPTEHFCLLGFVSLD